MCGGQKTLRCGQKAGDVLCGGAVISVMRTTRVLPQAVNMNLPKNLQYCEMMTMIIVQMRLSIITTFM